MEAQVYKAMRTNKLQSTKQSIKMRNRVPFATTLASTASPDAI